MTQQDVQKIAASSGTFNHSTLGAHGAEPRSEKSLPWWQAPWALRLGAGLIIVILWQFVVGSFAADYVARPLNVIKAIPNVVADGTFWFDTQSTIVAVIEGLILSIVIGTILGLVVGRLPDVHRVLGMYVNGFYALPIVALVPLLTVWFGYTEKARFVVIVIEAVLPIIYNVAEGARAIPKVYMDVTGVYRAPWWRQWFGVVLPASLPYVLAGVDIAVGRALIGAVVAEFIASVPGLGYYILFNVNSFHENEAFCALLLLSGAAVLFTFIVNKTVARTMPWYRTSEQGR